MTHPRKPACEVSGMGLSMAARRQVALPVGQLLVWLALAAVAGVIAAVGPARTASKMNVLEAIAYE